MGRQGLMVWIGAVAVVTGGTVGCGSGDDRSESRTADTVDEVRREAAKAGEAASEYLFEERQAFAAEAETRLQEMEARIDELRERAAAAGEQAAERTEEEMAALRERAADARARLDGLTERGGMTWEELKADLAAALDELEAAYDRLVERFATGC